MTKQQTREEENPKGMICECCGKRLLSVSYRSNSFAREIAEDLTAMHTVCDECDYQNKMDI